MVICTHPVVLQARTDGDITTIFHSFFFLKIAADFNDIDVERRIPNHRVRIDDLEMGVKMTVLGTVKDLEVETFSSFVVSTSDGSRYYCAFRCFKYRVFVAVSRLPINSFTREVFSLLQMENPADLTNILLVLSEIPVQPAASLRYSFQFSAGRTVALDFSIIEQTRDLDLDMVVVKLFSPRMLVAAWEAVILEKQIMIVSKTPSLVGPCCEFIRRLALPLTVVSTFIPLLHEAAVEMVESPVPYIVGVDAEILRRNMYLHYPDTIVIDLDAGVVTKQKDLATQSVNSWAYQGQPAQSEQHAQGSDCYTGENETITTSPVPESSIESGAAPPYLRERLYWDISDKMFPPLGTWFNHPCCGGNFGSDTDIGIHAVQNLRIMNSRLHPQAPCNVSFTLESVIQIFMETTLSLISARSCNVRAFFRRPESVGLSSVKDRITSQRSVSSMGFDRRDGIICGCMQLLRERKDDDMLHFLPCWVEIDGVSLVVYEYADELPLLHISASNVKSVSPSPIEPEGHVFDLEVRNQSTFRFAATGPESRRAWIEILEDLHHKAMAGPSTGAASAAPMSPTHAEGEGQMGSGGSGRESVHGGQQASEESRQQALTQFRLAIMQTQMVSYIRARVECEEYFPVLQEIKPKCKNLHTHERINGPVFERCLTKYLWAGNTVSNIMANLDDEEGDDPNLLLMPVTTTATYNDVNAIIATGPVLNSPGGSGEISSVTGHDINLIVDAEGSGGRHASAQFGRVMSIGSSISSGATSEAVAIPRSSSVGTGAPSSNCCVANACGISSPPVPISAPVPKRGSFFNMFKKTTSASPPLSHAHISNGSNNNSSNNSAESRRLRDEAREKEAEEARKVDLHSLLHLVAASYRRCEAELSNVMVEDRLACLSKLVRGVSNPPYSTFQTTYSSHLSYAEYSDKNCITISIADIVAQLNSRDPSARDTAAVANVAAATNADSTAKNISSVNGGVKDLSLQEICAANYALYSPLYWYVVAWRVCVYPFSEESNAETSGLVAEPEAEKSQDNGDGMLVLPPAEKPEYEIEPTQDAEIVSDIEIEHAVRRAWELQLSTAYNPEPRPEPTVGTNGNIGLEGQQFQFRPGSSASAGSGCASAAASASVLPSSVSRSSSAKPVDAEETAVDTDSSGTLTTPTASTTVEADSPSASISLSDEAELARQEFIRQKQAERRLLRETVARNQQERRNKMRDARAARILDLAKREILNHISTRFAALKTSGNDHLEPVLQAMLGYIHYRLRSYEEALKCYCTGALVSQKRIMFCIAMKFCDEFLEPPVAPITTTNATAVPPSPVTAAVPSGLTDADMSSPSPALSISTSLADLSTTPVVSGGSPQWKTNKIKSFLQWANGHGIIAGLQAYRLLTEIMHKRVMERLADAVLDENTGLNKKKVGISFPRVNMQSLMKKKRRKDGAGREHGQSEDGAAIVEEQGLQKGLVHGALSKARGGLGVDSPEFSYATPSLDLKTDVLNEVVICVTSSISACELSVQLLTKLREIVRAACERLASSTELPHLKNLNASNWFHMHIVPAMLENILTTSAYRSFELQTSQLQKVDLSSLDENEKVLFFVNAYNMAYVHAIIVKGLPGKNLYERTAFMRSSKYNLGGFVFSLVELEHGILRASSSSPMLFGPFSASMAFSGEFSDFFDMRWMLWSFSIVCTHNIILLLC